MNTNGIFWPRYAFVALAVIGGVVAAWNSLAFQFEGICAGFNGCQGPDHMWLLIGASFAVVGVVTVWHHYRSGGEEAEAAASDEEEQAPEHEQPPRL